MNKLQYEICRIMDFAPAYRALAFDEAITKEKLSKTYMLVNGRLGFISVFNTDNGYGTILFESGEEEIEIEKLKVFLPETGLYECENGAIWVEKYPRKQWKKSMHPDFYDIKWLYGTNLSIDASFSLGTAKKVQFYVSPNREIYAGKYEIGNIDDENKIKLKKFQFYQGIIDWIRKENLPWILHPQ